MALDAEMIADGGVGREDALCRPRRSEPRMLRFTTTRWLVRDFRPVVRSPADNMAVSQAEIRQGRAVGSEPFGDAGVCKVSLALEELP